MLNNPVQTFTPINSVKKGNFPKSFCFSLPSSYILTKTLLLSHPYFGDPGKPYMSAAHSPSQQITCARKCGCTSRAFSHKGNFRGFNFICSSCVAYLVTYHFRLRTSALPPPNWARIDQNRQHDWKVQPELPLGITRQSAPWRYYLGELHGRETNCFFSSDFGWRFTQGL